ncbi:MAG: molybdopterin-dependent oxidoreductase [Deferribacteraceae bacterium]|jgi:anaerobic selenocysteine-containing dehydrogenase|nr:molybdopterin-dependent oxidoreductase [Deferribacteraceae bacterium]
MKMLNNTKGLSKLSRRNFLKGTATLSAFTALYGCGKSNDETNNYYYSNDDPVTPDQKYKVVYGTSTHNCGGSCISKAFVRNGRIARIMTDESVMTGDGAYIDTNSRNMPQTRSCSRCRGYRYRVHHSGRLRYPLKQTGKRGDLSTFKRVSWDEALNDILTKHKRVYDKYGVDGIHVLYDSSANRGLHGRDAMETIYKYLPGNAYKWEFGSYSSHQNSYIGYAYTGMNSHFSLNDITKNTKTLIMWGDNAMTTTNPISYGYGAIARDMKKFHSDSQIIFIGPEFSDTGIVTADKWIVSKPFTDPALVAGIIYHMLEKTFNLDTGELLPEPWLDVNYLDTMVYGFFDSPGYSLDESSGNIDVPGTYGREVTEVPAGRSYCSWILGNNTKGKNYTENSIPSDTEIANYTANKFAEINPGFKRWSPCSYQVNQGGNTAYKTKQDFQTPKTPAWAEGITGVPKESIEELARIFCRMKPVGSLWSGGQQKQHDGIANLFAVQALHIITGNVSEYGAFHTWGVFNNPHFHNTAAMDALAIPNLTNAAALGIAQDIPKMPNRARFSCTAWHTTIKATYASELKDNGYQARYIPNWKEANDGSITTGDGNIYWDDAGTKARLLTWDRSNDADGIRVNTVTAGSTTYYKWKTDPNDASKPLISGIRLMYNSASNIIINQHENSNDSANMLECLNACNYNDADTFCLVTFDNFMSPTARWSDYVLPMSTSYEHPNIIKPSHGASFFAEQAVNPPGESKQAWNFGIEALQKYANMFPNEIGASIIPDAAAKYAGGDINNTVEQLARKSYYEGPYENPLSPFYRKSWEQYLKNPTLVYKPNDEYVVPVTSIANYDTKQAYKYLSSSDRLNNPFIKNGHTIVTNTYAQGGYAGVSTGAGSENGDFADISDAPETSLRYQVFSPVLVWQYEHQLDRWLEYYRQAGKAGQHNRDFESDPIVLPIPIYYAYEDYFMEAYGYGVNGKKAQQVNEDLPYMLTTTHDKFRSHSSLAENPLMRELCHRVPGQKDGKYKQGNDWGYYATAPNDFPVNGSGRYQYLASAIEEDGAVKPENKEIASYSEIWINEEDGKTDLGLKDGDLVLVENPIGAVLCVANLSKRCARGFVSLHQGNWYDPRQGIKNGYNHPTVDVGGNCNTLMASQPSRIDHGNGQQSAMVKITKVNQ